MNLSIVEIIEIIIGIILGLIIGVSARNVFGKTKKKSASERTKNGIRIAICLILGIILEVAIWFMEK